MTLGHMLFLCIALVVFIGIIYTVKPMHCPFSPFQLVQGHDTVPDTLLATGRIRCGCSLPRMSPSILANATAALSIDCSYSITSGKHHSSSWTVQQKQLSSFSSAVPEQLAVTGLDAVTCAVIQATADCAGSSISVDVTLQAQQQQQQYVFLLQRIDSGHHDDTLKGMFHSALRIFMQCVCNRGMMLHQLSVISAPWWPKHMALAGHYS